MAHIVLVIDSGESIAQLNARIQNPGNPHEAVVNVRNYCDALLGGALDASVQITVRDTDPSVSTSGSGSTQEDYNLA